MPIRTFCGIHCHLQSTVAIVLLATSGWLTNNSSVEWNQGGLWKTWPALWGNVIRSGREVVAAPKQARIPSFGTAEPSTRTILLPPFPPAGMNCRFHLWARIKRAALSMVRL